MTRPPTGRAVLVAGCTSWAGKSLLATALCRWYADRGLRVAPFKGQNMSNNARVAAGPPDEPGHPGGEIGVAQWLQARAARVPPDVRMNPVLVKPERTGSQVVVAGRADDELSALPWLDRGPRLWPAVTAALDSLLAEYDLVVCEGAGSPAETNLRATDLANLRVAEHADAPVLLVADIDRGGAFAHLYGTWALLPPAERARFAGFVLNRFRGDPTLLREAPAELAARTGMAYAGLLPMLDHQLPDEDGARDLTALGPAPSGVSTDDDPPEVAVVRYPSASNLDELTALATVTRLRWATRPGELAGADLVVLPGSKHVTADLAWLRRTGLAEAVRAVATRGTRVLGICGGLQLLGHRLAGGLPLEPPAPGLDLLDVATSYAPDKLVAHWHDRFGGELPGPWQGLAGLGVSGYDIRHGRTAAETPTDPAIAGTATGRVAAGTATDSAVTGTAGVPAAADAAPGRAAPATVPVLAAGRGWAAGSVLGVAGHGLLEDPAVVEAVVGVRPDRHPAADLEETLDALAGAVDQGLDTDLLAQLTRGLL